MLVLLGLTIGAGVPSVEVVKDYVETLGLKHISFKPGTISGIEQVISIAEAHPSFFIGCQWTGGRAGGHHSYEDFHTPILQMYGRIRKHQNIILTTGSGLGNAEGMLPYLTGSWSEPLGFPRMPFDGLLIGSRMMVAREAHTSHKVKELITKTPGTSELDWYNTYHGPSGGVITVKSEMGQPIHKLANRAVMLWSELDRTVFSIRDPAKRLATLRNRQDEIIARLNSDYARPWFAVTSDGNVEIDDVSLSLSSSLSFVCAFEACRRTSQDRYETRAVCCSHLRAVRWNCDWYSQKILFVELAYDMSIHMAGTSCHV